MLTFRFATEHDLPLLAVMNAELLEDEGHTRALGSGELERRMSEWLADEYRAVLYLVDGEPVAYTLYRLRDDGCHIRQFFVARQWRRRGVGRNAFRVLCDEVLPTKSRIFLDVLSGNQTALDFWRSLGFSEYAVTLELADPG